MNREVYSKNLNLMNLLVNTANCNSSTKGEKKGAEIAIVNQVRKVMSSLNYDQNEVSNMLTCGQTRILLQQGYVKAFDNNVAEKLNHVLNMLGINFIIVGNMFHRVK